MGKLASSFSDDEAVMANEVLLLEQVSFKTLTRSKCFKQSVDKDVDLLELTFVLVRMQNDPATCKKV